MEEGVFHDVSKNNKTGVVHILQNFHNVCIGGKGNGRGLVQAARLLEIAKNDRFGLIGEIGERPVSLGSVLAMPLRVERP